MVNIMLARGKQTLLLVLVVTFGTCEDTNSGSNSKGESDTFSKVLASETHERAKGLCRANRQRLPTPNNLIQHVKKQDIDISRVPLWLPHRRHIFKGWQTVTGESYASFLISKVTSRPGRMCSVIRTGDQVIDEIYCNQSTTGYVCMHTNSCPERCSPGAECVDWNGYCYEFFTQVATWFIGYNNCTMQNKTFAYFPEKEADDALEFMKTKIGKHGHFAFGLTRCIWSSAERLANGTASAAVTRHAKGEVDFRWAAGEPSHENNCVILTILDGTFYWESAKCNEQHNFICVTPGKVAKMIIPQVSFTNITPSTPVLLTIATVELGAAGFIPRKIEVNFKLSTASFFLTVFFVIIFTILCVGLYIRSDFRFIRMRRQKIMQKIEEAESSLKDSDT